MARKNEKKKITRRRVVIKLEDKKAKEVFLMGDFNKWDADRHPMKRGKDGNWERVIMIPPGRYEYKFLADGEWRNDPDNSDFCHNCYGSLNNVLRIC